MSVFLLSTKLHIPPRRANGVSRPRLTETLLATAKHPGSFALISGPAGFGKTTLLCEFLETLEQSVAWLSLDEADNDPIRFWTYLITACQSIDPSLGESGLAVLQIPQPLVDEIMPTILINDLVRLDTEVVLVLDDYQTIQNQTIHNNLVFLLDHLPRNLHLIVSTRVDPPWPLARFRARDQLIEIRAADLRFTIDETTTFLNQGMGLNLSSKEVAALEARTEGWIASLQLAAISMRGRADIPGFIEAFTGSHIYVAEYLLEEVLAHQSEEIKTFLLQTSILESLNASLCEAVSGRADSQALLKDLYQANLFILPLDDEGQWFRYHQLFADLLKARLQQTVATHEITTLHQRAADWYEQAGMTPEAIEHALAAKNYSHAVKLVEKNALPMILQAYVRTVDHWLRAIPRESLEQSPRALMAFAWMHLLRGAIDQATPYLERLLVTFSSLEGDDQAPSLLGEWFALQSKLLGLQGKSVESRDLANRALQILPEEDIHIRSMVYLNLAMAYQQMLDYEHAAETFRLIVQDARRTGNFTSEMLGISGQAQMVLLQGLLHLGYEIASEGINRLEESGKSSPFSATLYGELGQIYYHWHQLDEACHYFLRAVQTSGMSGYSDSEIYYHIILSRISQMRGDWETSAAEMQKANDLVRSIPPVVVREEVISQQVRVDLALGRIVAAQTTLKAEGFTLEDIFGFPDLAPGFPITHSTGLLYNSAFRVLLFQDRTNHDVTNLKRGIELADLVLAGELQCRHIPSALETLLLRSQMRTALGDNKGGWNDIVTALKLAESEGFISLFVEEGQPIAEALTILLKRNLLDTAQPDYVQNILAAFPYKQSYKATFGMSPASSSLGENDNEIPVLIEPLTPRELEVLRLIALGDSNQTIADKLVITLSAVKKHTGNIFGKLNVNSRTQAIARARQLGLISLDK